MANKASNAPPPPATDSGSLVTPPPAPALKITPPQSLGLKRYEVEFNGHTGTVTAENESHAKALFNDARKEWPSPKAAGWKVTEIGTVDATAVGASIPLEEFERYRAEAEKAFAAVHAEMKQIREESAEFAELQAKAIGELKEALDAAEAKVKAAEAKATEEAKAKTK